MYPGECFTEIPWERVEQRWRKEVEFRAEKGSKRKGVLPSVGGRATEWVNRDDVGELGRDRVTWLCAKHGVRYWAKLIRWEDDEDDEHE